MRLFSCIIVHEDSATPTQSLIMAQDERRACELALRELTASAAHILSIEIRENGRPLCVGGRGLDA